VDDFVEDYGSKTMLVDAARVALAHMHACKMLIPMSFDQEYFLKQTVAGLQDSIDVALAPNRIEKKHFTESSRVRNMTHGGMLGMLAVRLLNDPSQVERRSRTWNSLSIIQRVNGELGCEHVKWSIPEFQIRHNMGGYNFISGKGPFCHATHAETIAELNAINTAENRQKYIDDCNAVANVPTHSRVKYAECRSIMSVADGVLSCNKHLRVVNEWCQKFIHLFVLACSEKMACVNDNSLTSTARAKKLVDVYRFLASEVDWLLTSNLRFVCRLNATFEKFVAKLVEMSESGVPHSAVMLMRYFPEMMTPELHVNVRSTDIYNSIGMEIADDDPLFGPFKHACQAFMPQRRPRRQCDEDDFYNRRFYDDYGSNDDDDDDDNDDYDYDYDSDDNAQG